jgi:polysaccharide export outer membrane protein
MYRCNFRSLALLLALFTAQLTTLAHADEYLVNPGDILRVDVWNEELLSREVLVGPDGKIGLPIAGEVSTTKRTTAEVGEAITGALEKYMKSVPVVVVSLMQTTGNKVYVIGKVNQPGEYQINGDTDVMQALALAGGLNSFADENDIIILRRGDDDRQVAIPFEYSSVKTGEDLEKNIILQSRDVVVVP